MEKPNKSQQGRNPGNGGQRGIPGTSGPNPNNTWLNRFPAKDSVSTTLSPRTIVWGDSPDFNVDCRSEFGSYCEVYESRTSTNSTAARTVEAIALYPSGNSQGGYRFLLLNTGRLVTRNQWTKLPIPLSAADVIASLAKKDKQPDISKHGYIFSWARIKNFHNTDLSSVQQTSDEGANVLNEPENADLNSDDDTSYDPDSNSSSDDETLQADSDTDSDSSDDNSTVFSDSDNSDDNPSDSNDFHDNESTESNSENQGASKEDTTSKNEGAQDENENSEEEEDDDSNENDKENQGAINNTSVRKINSTKSKPVSKENTHYDLRQRSKKEKSFRRRFDRIHFQFLQIQRDIEQSELCDSTGLNVANFIQAQIMLTQMSVKRGIKLYGDKAISAIVKEF